MLALLAQVSSDDGTAESANLVGNLIIWGLWAVAVGAAIFVIVDTLRRPDWVWKASGQQKSLWIVLGIAAIVLCCFVITSVGVAGFYLFGVRPKLEEAQRRGPGGFGGPPGGFGGPPGGFGGPPGGFGGPPGGFGPPGGYPGGPPGGGASGSPGWGPPPPHTSIPPPPPPGSGGGGWSPPN